MKKTNNVTKNTNEVKANEPSNLSMWLDGKKKIINHNFLNGVMILNESINKIGIINSFSFQGIKDPNTKFHRGEMFFDVLLLDDYAVNKDNKHTKWFLPSIYDSLRLLTADNEVKEAYKHAIFERLDERAIRENNEFYYNHKELDDNVEEDKLPLFDKGWTIGYCEYETGKWRILKRCENDKEKDEYLEGIYDVLDEVEMQTLFLINDKDYMLEV